ncbi:hypothetical protein OCT51_09330 [Halomonas sp. LR3S48]|uniref:hypothetical protein n=1 Tax=Halomonas sp. LR3S48 TaxID=2982694 RepID=UPI0021E44C35|nr:hypothetical protein [Halomonas sp. LR3S48]UYG05541.1 hypothetical protein OCT51_09330 [Halomonas sp. LR3S48]
MTTQALSPARCNAVLALQNLRARRAPGSFDFEIADYAIDLVLSDQRPETDFLVVNALKDARSVLIRKMRRHRARGMLPIEETVNTATSQELAQAMIAAQRPLADNVASYHSYQQLRARLGDQGYLPECLDGWRDGEGLLETAQRLGISREYVKKLRGRIRSIAAQEVLC